MPIVTRIRDNVDCIELPGKKIFLVGTAHVSNQSADLVEEVIREYKPESVAIELCAPRLQALEDPNRWRNTDIVTVLRQGKGYLLLSQLLLSAFQKKIAGKLNIQPGAEMLRAVAIAREQGAELVLADREIKITLKRTWSALSLWSMMKVFWSVTLGTFGGAEVSMEEIERMKSSDVLAEAMREFSEKFPDVKRSLIEERDQYLCEKIRTAPGISVVAVVGAGHVPGIINWLEKPIDLEILNILPKRSLPRTILSWSIPILVISMIIYGFLSAGRSTGIEMVSSWILINGVSAAIGSILALAHPITILVAFVAAPFALFHPGWVAGIVEAILRKPRVADLSALTTDVTTIRGWWSNRVSRILLIMALTNLCGRIGSIIAAWDIFKHL